MTSPPRLQSRVSHHLRPPRRAPVSDPNPATARSIPRPAPLLRPRPRPALRPRPLDGRRLARSSPRRPARPATGSSPPLVTLAAFLGQVLTDDHSCQAAVDRLIAWRARPRAARLLGRHRRLLQGPAAAPRGAPAPAGPRHRRPARGAAPPRAGCSTAAASSSPTARRSACPTPPENQAEYPQHGHQKPGCGFPIARIVVLIALATGGVLDAAIGAAQGEADRRDAPCSARLHGRLKRGRHPAGRQLLQLVRRGGDARRRWASTW